MSGKITLPKPKPAPNVQPVNAGKVKAHYVEGKKAGSDHWVMWCIIIIVLAMGAAGYHWIEKAVSYLQFEARERGLAVVGRQACMRPALPEPQILCADTDLDCLTNPTIQEVDKLREIIRDQNAWQLDTCLRVM